MFDVFIEVHYHNKPKKIIYKSVVHENLLLIQHVSIVDKDFDLGRIELDRGIYPGPKYESMSGVRVTANFLEYEKQAGEILRGGLTRLPGPLHFVRVLRDKN